MEKQSLTRADFLAQVCDYEKGGPWQFLGPRPCVIDFYDEGCAPCRALKPVYEQVAVEFGDRVDFFTVDVTQEEQLARELGVEHLPTLVLCPREGGPIVMAGMASKEKLASVIESRLLPSAGSGV